MITPKNLIKRDDNKTGQELWKVNAKILKTCENVKTKEKTKEKMKRRRQTKI